ncbi:AraC family transcriptional activator FtrA [Allocatelliglobosispora scoriae]|uniref:AraC family transcriptional activator FtrA n=1 Tax=Allocatelliglobosispora scoriae TaxID=643052 RepID=A0A841BNX1_9ACTN|nr:helix-turn-helix domain-containing protein [Allocatelliglobosispora scoriae]MBB5869088.1 AraC family transcriptional activator FtrA [Allocatelliglobosispora scoriae]
MSLHRRHRVAAFAFPGMSPFELGCVIEVFGLPRPEIDRPWYDMVVCGESRAPMRVLGGMSIVAEHGLEVFAEADTLVVTAVPDVLGAVPEALVGALRAAYNRGARLVSICSGAFALAAAGLLDGREATTHWRYARILQQRYPLVRVNPDVLYLDDGRVLTSAGSAAGLDLSLHIVRSDHGSAVANSVARRLVLPPHREGGQAQFIEAAVPEIGEHDGVAAAMAWALDHLAEPITLEELARRAHLSTRSFLRHFGRRAGTSPVRWLIAQRVAASLPLLEGSTLPVEEIAGAVGFDSAVTFRHHFGRAMHTSPSGYRRAFRPAD